MSGKLLFLDIDGTLTEPGYNIPPASALEAIKKAQANGHKVYLCSGRNRAMLKPLLAYNFDGYVASAGGYVVSDGEVVFDRPMKPEVFRLAYEYSRAHRHRNRRSMGRQACYYRRLQQLHLYRADNRFAGNARQETH